MFISTKEKKQLWSALEELTAMVNKLRVDMESPKYGYRLSDGAPRIKPGRPAGSKKAKT